MADVIVELKKLVIAGVVVIGSESAVKGLKRGEVSRVFVASDCADRVQDDLRHYCTLSRIPFEVLGIDGAELGVICKKQFSISVVSVLKPK